MASGFYKYALGDGWMVLAGKTDADNDRLSAGKARPNDYWFHVRGMSGSHVVLAGPEGLSPTRAMLEQAAAVAAYHSKARNGGTTAVSCTQAKHVSKPKGAKQGAVRIRKETVLKVRPGIPDSGSR